MPLRKNWNPENNLIHPIIMISKAKTPAEYYKSLPVDRKKTMLELRKVIRKNLPAGFKETMGYGMPGWVVPHTIYPSGYHCDPKLPLPFLSVASQKGSINLYHMGLYADPKLTKWFQTEFKKASSSRLDMGKSCIRFTQMDQIPFSLIGKLAKKMNPKDWIQLYESKFRR